MAVALQGHHLEVGAGHRDAGQTGGETAAEVGLSHLSLQREGCTGVDIVPVDVKGSGHGVHVLILLIVLLVVESFQLHGTLVDPLTTL